MRKAMHAREYRDGWTLIELLVAMVSAAVLALSLGSILVSTSQAWQRHSALREVQDDALLTGRTLSTAIREAQNSSVSLPVGSTTNRITLGRRAFYRANARLQYAATGSVLAYDPDTNAVNDVVALCRDHVTVCDFTRGTNAVSFLVGLTAQGQSNLVKNSGVFFRN